MRAINSDSNDSQICINVITICDIQGGLKLFWQAWLPIVCISSILKNYVFVLLGIILIKSQNLTCHTQLPEKWPITPWTVYACGQTQPSLQDKKKLRAAIE